jgi:hypothetical protein
VMPARACRLSKLCSPSAAASAKNVTSLSLTESHESSEEPGPCELRSALSHLFFSFLLFSFLALISAFASHWQPVRNRGPRRGRDRLLRVNLIPFLALISVVASQYETGRG